MSDVYKVYYETDKTVVVDREFTKEQLYEFLNCLPYAQRSCLKVQRVKGKGSEDVER